MPEKDWEKKWDRRIRNRKIFILGGRAGTTLVHKCLLITGLVNWGTWSLHTYESEAPVKEVIWTMYPDVIDDYLKSIYPFEIAKCPDFGFVIDQLEVLYPKPQYIIMKRNVKDAADSHIKTWGNYVINIWKERFPNWHELIKNTTGKKVKDDRNIMIENIKWREQIQDISLSKISEERKLYVEFNDLMNDFDGEMKRIADFTNIPYDIYIPLWRELRKIKLMATTSDVKDYI